MRKLYGKLVRDHIPEIIELTGKTCVKKTLSDAQYLEMLDAKLDEDLEELADPLEVMRAVVQARGWTWEGLEQVRQEKAAQRGGFEKRILLKEVIERN